MMIMVKLVLFYSIIQCNYFRNITKFDYQTLDASMYMKLDVKNIFRKKMDVIVAWLWNDCNEWMLKLYNIHKFYTTLLLHIRMLF